MAKETSKTNVTEKKDPEKTDIPENPSITLWKCTFYPIFFWELMPFPVLCDNIRLLEKGVARKDRRILSRVFRNNSLIRSKASPAFLKIASAHFIPTGENVTTIISALDSIESSLVALFFPL
jgi:hypothetical protein